MKQRIYGAWTGDPEGRPEDPTRCIEKVWPPMWDGGPPYQCQRKRGYGPDGLYCKQHAKKIKKGVGWEIKDKEDCNV